jgi:hypothetical protein
MDREEDAIGPQELSFEAPPDIDQCFNECIDQRVIMICRFQANATDRVADIRTIVSLRKSLRRALVKTCSRYPE